MDVLSNMPEKSVQFDGSSYLLDSRLISNGFKIKIIPGMMWLYILLLILVLDLFPDATGN